MATRRARPTPGLVVVAAHHHPPLEDHRSEESTPRSLLTTAPLPVADLIPVEELLPDDAEPLWPWPTDEAPRTLEAVEDAPPPVPEEILFLDVPPAAPGSSSTAEP